MATLVSCPKCRHKLKVAPATLGKSVKCSCGNVFKATEPDAAAPVAETLLVSCEVCGTRLKVLATSRGRKMKCSKCAATFVVHAEDAPPVRAGNHQTAPPSPFVDEPLEDMPAVKPARVPTPPFLDDVDVELLPRPAKRGKAPPTRDAIATPTPAPKPAPPTAAGAGGCLLNLFVLFIVIAYAGVLVPTYLGYVPLPFEKPPPAPAKGSPVVPAPENANPPNGD
jgi:hypothetical protein